MKIGKSCYRVLIKKKHYSKNKINKYHEHHQLVKSWPTEFRCGRTSISDAERFGRQVRNQSARWVPRLLTIYHKRNLVAT